MGRYAVLTLVLYAVAIWVDIDNLVLKLLFRTALLSVFIVYMVKRDLPIKEIPLINKLIKK